ncbi:DUF6355 family natural product biosynthesis protein [Lentzea sp. DG1S-22]|uniref:DUF6355 family natural product biosynthesis protein n=1 Tax=Lentzea sp. DG1S-22 TaxID=3108822 RepID=UPI003FA5FACE
MGLIDAPLSSATRIIPPRCGFYEVSAAVGELTARYAHCADSFILIKYHRSTGTTGTSCVSPWWQVPFFPGRTTQGRQCLLRHYPAEPDRPTPRPQVFARSAARLIDKPPDHRVVAEPEP